MAAVLFYGWLTIAFAVFVLILLSLNHDRKIRQDREKVRMMIRESERRG